MTYERKEPKVYTREHLSGMDRKELNTVAVSVGHMPSDISNNPDVVNEILAAQKVMLEKLMIQRKQEDIDRENEDEEFAKKRGKKLAAEAVVVTEVDMKKEGKAKPGKVLREGGHSVDRGIPDSGVDIPEGSREERVWFKVASGEGKMGKSPMFASLNGESILVKRGEWVQLKKKFLGMLQDAVVTEVDQDREGEKTLRDVPRFNYQVRSLSEGKPKESQAQSRSSF